MKRNIFVLCLPLLLLTACQGSTNPSSSSSVTPDPQLTTKNVTMYAAYSSLIGEDGNIDLDAQTKSSLPLAFLAGQEYLPYINVATFVRAFGTVENYITNEGDDGKSYAITLKRNDKTFSFVLDSQAKSMSIAGDFRYIINGAEEKETSSNLLEGKVTNGVVGDPNKAYIISFAETELTLLSSKGSLYAPLGLLDAVFFKLVGVGCFYAYDRIYIYNEPMAFHKLRFKDKTSPNSYTAAQKMGSLLENKTMPMYLRRYNRDIVTFLFENYYGLKYSLGIASVASYFKSTSYYEQMLSETAEVRANALYQFIRRFHDGHTGLLSYAGAWDENVSKDIPQSLVDTRSTIEASLIASRKAVYDSLGLKVEQVRYSKDGSTAVFPLMKFAAYDNYFDAQGKPTTTPEVAAKEDTYLQSKAYFEEIDKKGGVKNVIIDMSVNEGGDSATMGNLLTLLSKDNKSTMCFHDVLTNTVLTAETRLDTNRDGKVDEKDVTYGKYKIYLLVSPCAFSCGTAYPFYAEAQKLATIIGQKPAGGECVLAQAILPNGQCLAHSGTLRVCFPKGDGYIYDEAGPEIDTDFRYDEFYDLEKMVEKLKEDEE